MMFWYIDVIESCCTKWGTWAGRRRRAEKEKEREKGKDKERGGNGRRREFMCCSVCVRMTDFSRVDIQCEGSV